MSEQSLAAIAEFLGVTTNTVKTRLYAARQRLRSHMSDIEKKLGDARPSRDSPATLRSQTTRRRSRLRLDRATRSSSAFCCQPDLASRVTVSRPREIAKLLFEHGMDPNRPNWLRITPLHYFAETSDVESAALFLDHGADIKSREEEWSATPLGWAAAARSSKKTCRPSRRHTSGTRGAPPGSRGTRNAKT
jgi:hypothetical protein